MSYYQNQPPPPRRNPFLQQNQYAVEEVQAETIDMDNMDTEYNYGEEEQE
jgi:hypothetical protein